MADQNVSDEQAVHTASELETEVSRDLIEEDEQAIEDEQTTEVDSAPSDAVLPSEESDIASDDGVHDQVHESELDNASQTGQPGAGLPDQSAALADEAAGPPKNWYIIHAYSGFEQKVAESLRSRAQAFGFADRLGQILIPTEEVI